MFPMIDKKETGRRLKYLMELKGLTPKDIQKYLSLSCVQTVYRWLEGINIPTIDNLYALCQLFQVQLDMLVAGNGKHLRTDWKKMRMFSYYVRLNERRAVLGF